MLNRIKSIVGLIWSIVIIQVSPSDDFQILLPTEIKYESLPKRSCKPNGIIYSVCWKTYCKCKSSNSFKVFRISYESLTISLIDGLGFGMVIHQTKYHKKHIILTQDQAGVALNVREHYQHNRWFCIGLSLEFTNTRTPTLDFMGVSETSIRYIGLSSCKQINTCSASES